MKGIGVSPGISIGKVFLKEEIEIKVEKKNIESSSDEIAKLNDAIEKSLKEVKSIHEYALKNLGEKEAEIFSAHKLMLEDPEFIGLIKGKIEDENVNAEWGVQEASNNYISILENMDNEYLKERAADIKDISKRLINNLMGIENISLSTLEEECIIVSKDLAPSDTAQMRKDKVLGFVTEVGGRTSHTSIMARTLELPAVVGVKDITKAVKSNDIIIIDGDEGTIIINPTQDEINAYKEKRKAFEEFKNKLKELKNSKSISKDDHKVEIAGNIGTPKDIDKVIENGGEGVGLYRTEFLYMDRDKLPTEEEQFKSYKIVAEKLEGRPLVIRTLDVGGDKELPYLEMPKEMNPFLGYRAIRLCLDRVDIFKVQLRAILRASAYGNVKIMFPMVSNLKEFRDAKQILEEMKSELRAENIPFNENIEVGIMVEIPSAAIQSDVFAKEVDFFSIGTNDLIQYTLAVDRGNENISYLYSQYHPAVLRLIKMTIENGHKEGIWVGMCGEAAGDERLIPILLGMGLDEFSMSASSILKARYTIKNISKVEMENMIEEVLNLETPLQVKQYIDEKITFKH
ncbi:phosphoenolpyruvate--protein phosphotransferase [Sporanaerobacter acetigenes]|uniref:Phosphoenolpyruvate-protein phosphotransferase n=1 Tax=Sporanaerobacter acetigenes DSM 13106 TaxID=1123281 RepID=A0A1M5XB18_9FIRM|nr:phosphoenolpyruvate--protein phosphotransferase [Sporanaerobacter acetigenes]SHH96976.1 phosphotransferase system, enzyme I, PtsI [Sporanaerobacter acetigenes DSM 13106]